MATIKRFEEIIAWQEARRLDDAYACARKCSYLIYQFLDSLRDSAMKGMRYA